MIKNLSESELPLSLPPPPPPPPPRPINKNNQLKNQATTSGEEELNIISKRLLDEKFSKIFYTSNTFLKPQLQEGPQCGLVALSIASSVNENFVAVDSIYQKAVQKGFTKLGEIFDANSLAVLAEECCGFKAKVLQEGLTSHLWTIIKILLGKNLLLIPYDADFNHSPCCKKGFKAHWAVITGFIIFELCESSDLTSDLILVNSLNKKSDFLQKPDNNYLILSKHENDLIMRKISTEDIESNNFKKGEIYLVGLQGKSKHIGVWNFDEMNKSNDNLLFFSTNRDSDCYIIPADGPAKGLKGKIVVLEKRTYKKE